MKKNRNLIRETRVKIILKRRKLINNLQQNNKSSIKRQVNKNKINRNYKRSRVMSRKKELAEKFEKVH